MKPLRPLYWMASALFLSATAVAAAQDASCPAIVREALAATDSACANTGRNEACYGNISLEAQAQPGVADFNFTEPGDLVNVAGVQTLTLTPLDQEEDTWGVALMKLQANLPETLPGQNVTFLLFGDVEIENAVSSNVEEEVVNAGEETTGGITLDVSITSMAPLIESLDGTGAAMPVMLDAGTTAVADSYFEMAQMVHITLEDGSGGWVPTAMVQIDGDVTTLPAFDINSMMPGLVEEPVTTTTEPEFTPMQAFYFKSGANDAPCEEAPDSGILIQTPEGAGKIDLVVNDAKITLGSTGYFQAQAGGDMTITVVEGEGIVEADGETVTVPAGTYTTLPIDNDLRASGPPEDPQPYDPDSLQALPVKILPQTIAIAPALEVTPEVEATDTITLQPGTWTSTLGEFTVGGGCPPMMGEAMSNADITGTRETFEMPEGAFNLQGLMEANSDEMFGGMTYSHPEPNLYMMDGDIEGSVLHYEFRIVSPTQIDMQYFILVEGCELTMIGTLTAVE
jgi:hypothetical protein